MNRRKYYNETIEKRKKIVSESMFSKVTKRAFREYCEHRTRVSADNWNVTSLIRNLPLP